MQLVGLEPTHNSRLMAMPLPIGLQLLECLRQDLNLQHYGPKPYASANWATQAHGGCRIRTCIGVTLDGLADRSNDHSGNPPIKGRVGFEPTKCVSTLILQTSPIDHSGNDPERLRWVSNPLSLLRQSNGSPSASVGSTKL